MAETCTERKIWKGLFTAPLEEKLVMTEKKRVLITGAAGFLGPIFAIVS